MVLGISVLRYNIGFYSPWTLDPGRERMCPFSAHLPPTNYLWRGISCVLLMSIAGGRSGSSQNARTCKSHSGIRQPVSLFIHVLAFSLRGMQTN